MEPSRDDQDPPAGASPPGQSPAGWYPDPQDPSRSRYWNGTAWTSWHRKGPGTPPPPPPYRPLAAPAWAVLTLLAAYLVVIALSVLADWGQLDLTNRLTHDPAAVTDAELTTWDARLHHLNVLQTVLYLATGVTFIAWFRRAYQNLVAFRTESLRFEPGWAVGAWLVPLLNLVRPKQITDDLWRATDPALPDQPGGAWKQVRVPPWLHAWWLLFVLSGIVGILAPDLAKDASMEQIRRAIVATLAGDALALPAGFLACLVVMKITQRQRGRAARLVTS